MKGSPFAQFERALAAESKPNATASGTFAAVTMPPEMKEALRQRAKADGRTLANYCRRILAAHLEGTPAPGKVQPLQSSGSRSRGRR